LLFKEDPEGHFVDTETELEVHVAEDTRADEKPLDDNQAPDNQETDVAAENKKEEPEVTTCGNNLRKL